MATVVVKGVTLMLREMTQRDRAYVSQRWVHSYSAARADVPRPTYRRRWNALVNQLLDRSRVVMLCSPREESAVFGFACVEGDVLHYVYVEPKFWRCGAGRALVTAALGDCPSEVRCTHRWPWRTERYVHDWFPLTGAERQTDADDVRDTETAA